MSRNNVFAGRVYIASFELTGWKIICDGMENFPKTIFQKNKRIASPLIRGTVICGLIRGCTHIRKFYCAPNCRPYLSKGIKIETFRNFSARFEKAWETRKARNKFCWKFPKIQTTNLVFGNRWKIYSPKNYFHKQLFGFSVEINFPNTNGRREKLCESVFSVKTLAYAGAEFDMVSKRTFKLFSRLCLVLALPELVLFDVYWFSVWYHHKFIVLSDEKSLEVLWSWLWLALQKSNGSFPKSLKYSLF